MREIINRLRKQSKRALDWYETDQVVIKVKAIDLVKLCNLAEKGLESVTYSDRVYK